MGAVRKLDIKNQILSRATCLGNSNIGLKDVCSSLIGDAINRGMTLQQIADQSYLSTATVDRMLKLKECESGEPYRPKADTCERIFRSFGAGIHFEQVKISRKFQNKPKEVL